MKLTKKSLDLVERLLPVEIRQEINWTGELTARDLRILEAVLPHRTMRKTVGNHVRILDREELKKRFAQFLRTAFNDKIILTDITEFCLMITNSATCDLTENALREHTDSFNISEVKTVGKHILVRF